MPDAEKSLGSETSTDPAAAGSPFGTPNPGAGTPPVVEPPVVSIIDTILQLDDFLSGDVRRAEKTARFCSKPWLEADIDQLNFELRGLVDTQGNPLPRGEVAVGETRTAEQVALEIATLQAEMGAAFVSVRMAQLPADKWQEFRTTWREVLDKGAPHTPEFYDAVIGVSAKTPTISAEQSAQLRKKLGEPQMDELAKIAWAVNTESGVSIPKSSLSSLVLREAARSRS